MGDEPKLPPLRRSISTIKRLAHHAGHVHTPKKRAELFEACVLFLCHLKADQSTLLAAWNEKAKGSDKCLVCPLPHNMPAISSLLEDAALFNAFLGMLQSKHPIDAETSTHHSHGGPTPMNKNALHKQISDGRKRSASVSLHDKGGEKHPKLTHSPSSGNPPFHFTSSQEQLIGHDFNGPVFSATVFFTAFLHLDHWPAALIRAYAEDCFGLRLWVDDKRCSLLVENLSLIHSGRSNEELLGDADKLSTAKQYARYYAKLTDTENLTETPSLPSSVNKPRPDGKGRDVKSTNVEDSSSDSDSGDEECVLEVSCGTAKPLQKDTSQRSLNPSNDDSSSSSSSGDETGDEVLVAEVGIAPSSKSSIKTTPEAMAAAALAHYQSFGAKPALVLTKDGKDIKAEENNLSKEDNDVASKDPGTASLTSADAGASASVDQAPEASSLTSSIPVSPTTSNAELSTDLPSLWHQKTLDLNLVRNRYFGENHCLANQAISEALSQRIGVKSKQNSRLLQTLPDFTSVPGVRSLAAHRLERWLQSPALSGLARSLFLSIVRQMKNVDPPLEEDVKAIDSILSMKLKANQLNTHVENITTIAKTIPTLSISRHIFLRLLREDLADRDGVAQGSSSNMTFFVSVYESLPSSLGAHALASVILTILREESAQEKASVEHVHESTSTLGRVTNLIRDIAAALGSSYDGHLLIKALLEPNEQNARPSSPDDADDVARIAYECMTLMAPTPTASAPAVGGYHRQHSKMHRQASSGLHANARHQDSYIPEELLRTFRYQLLLTRKIAIRWCLSTYAKLVGAEISDVSKPRRTAQRKLNAEDSLQGAGTPDYSSVLDGETPPENLATLPRSSQRLMKVVRCLLFLSRPESKEHLSFILQQNDSTAFPANQEQVHRMKLCYEHGADLDDEIIWVILKASKSPNATISKQMALTLTEHLFLSCRLGQKAKLCLRDSSIIWELYELTEYSPAAIDGIPWQSSSDESSDDDSNAQNKKRKASVLDGKKNEVSLPLLPRLAYPGMWWRVTALALVMCGADCSEIGAKMFEECPTLQALIKMITSERYRFPTADCDDDSREAMKKGEADLREQEMRVTERLFLPKPSAKAHKKKRTSPPPPAGSRVSARQREKQAKLLARQREKEAATALAEAQRRKKILRSAQKTIMVWDPRGSARKPPKDSVDLILSVNEMFGLSESLRLCKQPDFLLRTIGCTSRASIERAYDWLIPIISSHPETINRLPSSASCFLLLRAYGTEGDQNNLLLELSAPLLRHVSGCLSGEFGEEDALRAADLLLLDIADQNPDRRLCARRVLQEAVGRAQSVEKIDHLPYEDDLSWLFNLLCVKHSSVIIANAIKHASHAIAYERGEVLRALLLALNKYIEFAHEKNLGEEHDFSELLCELISVRPHVCCSVMDRFSDVRDLALSVASRTFQTFADKPFAAGSDVPDLMAKLSVRCASSGANGHQEDCALRPILLPLHLLRASLVLVSNWQVRDDAFSLGDTTSEVTDHSDPRSAVTYLLRCLIIPPRTGVGGEKHLPGAAGAICVSNKSRAVSVEQWVMLAKSRCDAIARLAALSAPDIFLPRLLLCSGLPRTSLLSMLERLGKMGDASSEPSKCFRQLLAPSATSEWGTGHLGSRRMVARKLLGRISAYLHLENTNIDAALQEACASSFVKWLLDECSAERMKKARSKTVQTKISVPDCLKSVPATGSFSSLLTKDDSHKAPATELLLALNEEETAFSAIVGGDSTVDVHSAASISVELVNNLICQGDFTDIENVLNNSDLYMQETNGQKSLSSQMAQALLLAIQKMKNPPQLFRRIVLKWVPYLTQFDSNSALWEVIFAAKTDDFDSTGQLLVTRCADQWNETQAFACHCWMLDQLKNDDGLGKFSLPMMLRFIVATSGQPSIQRTMFVGMPSPKFNSVGSQEHAAAAVKLAMKCAQLASHVACKDASETNTGINGSISLCSQVHSRNLLPDWLNLLLLVARCGKKHLALVTSSLISRLPSESWEGALIPAALLRLYIYFPSTMNLSDAKVRGVLVNAATVLASDWLDWRCPLDDQLGQMVSNLATNPSQRLLQTITDVSKRHPLVVSRKLRSLAKVLTDDGAVLPLTSTGLSSGTESRGRINAGVAEGVAVASTKTSVLKVTARHWGYSFTEPVWASVLDILSCLPNEVVFSCGPKMGLIEIFSAYVSLIWTQQDLNCPMNTARLRTKLAALFSDFQTFDAAAWAEWMESRVSGLEKAGPVRELTRSCAIAVVQSNDHTA